MKGLISIVHTVVIAACTVLPLLLFHGLLFNDIMVVPMTVLHIGRVTLLFKGDELLILKSMHVAAASKGYCLVELLLLLPLFLIQRSSFSSFEFLACENGRCIQLGLILMALLALYFGSWLICSFV
jgi:hypothetical protein